MAEQQTIKYAPQWNNMTVDNVTFQTNNVVGNFNYPPNVPIYKPMIKFLQNCPLYKVFTNCPSMVYQNFLREFWSTVVSFDPFPSTDEPEKRPLKEFLIKLAILNGQKSLTLDFNTFYSSTVHDYNNGKYVDHLTPEVLGRNYSSTEQVNAIQQLLAYSLITGTEVDIGEIIYSDLVTKLLNKSRLKYVSYPRFISCALQVLLGPDYTQDEKFRFLLPILSNSNFTKDPSKVTDIELTAHMIVVNNRRDSVSPPPFSAKKKSGKSQTDLPLQQLQHQLQPLASTCGKYVPRFCRNGPAEPAAPPPAAQSDKWSSGKPDDRVSLQQHIFSAPANEATLQPSTRAPAQFLKIDAELRNDITGFKVLSGTCEFPVPREGHCSIGHVTGGNCSLKLRVRIPAPPVPPGFDSPRIRTQPTPGSSANPQN
ncbi:hypothetical protein Tco_1108175 [Tanacetum coccineum]